jgi:hypothetical protein
MNTRERFHAVMNFQPFDRLPVLEWATWWNQTIERWHSEGLPKEITDRYDLYQHFGLEQYKQGWLRPRSPDCPQPKTHGAGIITSREDYERVRPYLYPRGAVDYAQWERWREEQQAGDAVLWFTVDGFFWFPRTLLGIERHLYAFYDQPDLMRQINDDLVEWILSVVDEICSICTPDFMTFAEDMSYNHGPMVSKKLFDRFLRPCYDRVIPRLLEKGILPIIDSDGDVTIPAYWFEEAGIQGVLPLERQAGVDIARLRWEHPRMRFIGHFDKMTMWQGEAAMRAEFERLLTVAEGGGYLISVDHQTPPNVSYSEYQLFLSLFREYAVEAGRRQTSRP